MPGREVPLVTDQFYHVLNRGVGSQLIFLNKRDYQRAWDSVFYYQNQKPALSYSHFLRLPIKQRTEFLERLQTQSKFLVKIITLCFLPNHFHLLLKQVRDNGISLFMANLANSYTRYFNTKNERTGHLFQGKFKAVMIETNEQLLHVSRYIHLNPYSSYLVKNLNQLNAYSYSSLPEYLGISPTNFFQKEIILDQFKSISAYKKFIFDQADYQRDLEQIKHLTLER